MKQKLIRITGHILYVAGWPFWVIYFRVNWQRSRVLLVCGDEVLLVQGIINKAGNWSLPGGGCEKGESPEDAAVRELEEEVGIKAGTKQLHYLGAKKIHSGFGIQYTAEYFTMSVPQKPAIKMQPHEIVQTIWVRLADVNGYPLQPDAKTGLQELINYRKSV